MQNRRFCLKELVASEGAGRKEAQSRVTADTRWGCTFRGRYLLSPQTGEGRRNRIILPALNRCEICQKSEGKCDQKTCHACKRDTTVPEWHGWHAARRGLGSNLYRMGVADMVIQRILRHANVSTTATYYIKTGAEDVKHAMENLCEELQPLERRDQHLLHIPSGVTSVEFTSVIGRMYGE